MMTLQFAKSQQGVAAPAPSANSPVTKPLYSAREAQRVARVRAGEFYADIHTGKLPAFRPGKRNLLIRHADLMAYIDARAAMFALQVKQ